MLGSRSGFGEARGQGAHTCPPTLEAQPRAGAVTARSGGGGCDGAAVLHLRSPWDPQWRATQEVPPEVGPGLDGAPSVFTQPPPSQGDVTGAPGTAQP